MKAIEYLKSVPRTFIPRQPSNSELNRWLNNGSVTINREKPRATDEITLPVRQLIFFSGNKKVIILDEIL